MAEITVTVDGVKYSDHVEPRMLLVHYLREVVGKTGTPIGCDTSNCGACTVLLDGQSVKSCSVLAVQADGADITTIQGLANGGLHPLQRAFHEEHALQCGYCTPGMILAASDLLRENPHPSDDEIRDGIELLARTTGIFAETAGGVTVSVLRKLLADGLLDPAQETVIYNTGDGLKTLDAVRDTFRAHEVEPSVESFSAELGVTA